MNDLPFAADGADERDRCPRCGRVLAAPGPAWPGELCSWCSTGHGPMWPGDLTVDHRIRVRALRWFAATGFGRWLHIGLHTERALHADVLPVTIRVLLPARVLGALLSVGLGVRLMIPNPALRQGPVERAVLVVIGVLIMWVGYRAVTAMTRIDEAELLWRGFLRTRRFHRNDVVLMTTETVNDSTVMTFHRRDGTTVNINDFGTWETVALRPAVERIARWVDAGRTRDPA